MTPSVAPSRNFGSALRWVAMASKALDRAGFKILATGLTQCIAEPGAQSDRDREDLEKLFLTLA